MKLLLDTHVLIWLGDGSPRLGAKTRRLLTETPAANIKASYISFWEIAIKATAGKLPYSDSVFDDTAAAGLEILYPGRAALKTYRVYNTANKDPFDNMLLAVAETEDCAFITADARVLATKNPPVELLDARL